jgi:predicted Zn-dependent peptidase
LSQLATLDLPDDTFDRFVPAIESVAADDVQAAAKAAIKAAEATVVVVGDAQSTAPALESLGRRVELASPEF